MKAVNAGYAELRARWELVRKLQRTAYAPEQKVRTARAREMIATLESWYGLTRDPDFVLAIRAAKKHGLDHQDSGTLKRLSKVRQNDEEIYLKMMHRLRRKGTSARMAAAYTAVAYSIDSAGTFDAVVKKLQKLQVTGGAQD